MNDSHWSVQKEAAAGYWNVKLMLILFRLLPIMLLRLLAFPVGFFYFLFSKKARNHSIDYLRHITDVQKTTAQDTQNGGGQKKLSSLVHIVSFALALVEKVEAWGGKVSSKRVIYNDDDIDDLTDKLEKGEGVILISSHLGNMEFIRALAEQNRTKVSREIPVNAIVDFTVTAHFTRMLKELNPHSTTRLLHAAEMGADTVMLLQDRLAAGEMVVIAGDRTAAGPESRYLSLPFLGENAPFPYGPFFLAALLNVPVYLVFAVRENDLSLKSRYSMFIHKCSLSFDCPRREREQRIKDLMLWFVSYLEQYCQRYPYQWYNFFDFWKEIN